MLQEVEYDFPDVANIGAPTAIVCIVHLIAQGCPPRNTRCLHDNAPTVIVSNDRPMHTRTSFTTFNTCISDVFILYTHRSRDHRCARRGHASASANDATAFYADSTFSAFCHKGLVSGGYHTHDKQLSSCMPDKKYKTYRQPTHLCTPANETANAGLSHLTPRLFVSRSRWKGQTVFTITANWCLCRCTWSLSSLG